MRKIALLASGSGSNVQNIAEYFRDHTGVEIALVLTNNLRAGVIDRCKALSLPLVYASAEGLGQKGWLLSLLQGLDVDFIVLAGWLKMIPEEVVSAYPNALVNIHPALLPDYGGHGMYGMKVHEAVKKSGALQTGISIHWVDELYDNGALIEQHRVDLSPEDQPEDIAKKVHQLEYVHYPKAIERLLGV
mgnify:FL=1|jgi:phosphoribosylglycinamide formyltransferase-1